ncbi:hypothetical protein [Modestobacter lapidis]|nr:hypothetical protein [Modestobacter lapidis]
MPRFATDRNDPHFAMYWVTEGPFPKQLSDVVMYAHREGLISADDLFDRTDDWMADAAKVDRLLWERGAWAAYRKALTPHLFFSECPFWCHGQHPKVGIGGAHCDAIHHQLPVGEYTRADGSVIEVVINTWQDDTGMEPPQVDEFGVAEDDVFDAEELVFLADAHKKAEELLRAIKMHGGDV